MKQKRPRKQTLPKSVSRLLAQKPKVPRVRSRTRWYRKDKFIPQGFTLESSQDLGPYKEIRTFKADNVEVEERIIPKEKSPNWETIFTYGHWKIKHAILEDRYFFYYNDRILEEISLIEMHEFFKRGLFSVKGFEEVIRDRKNGVAYTMMKVLPDSTWKRRVGILDESRTIQRLYRKIEQERKQRANSKLTQRVDNEEKTT
jgi:hypothetical protein